MIVNLSKKTKKEEDMSLKDVKINYIIQEATALFLEKSISDITIKDIADRAGVGEATVYRYFSRKQNIVNMSAVSLQKVVYNEYFRLSGKDGYSKIEKFYRGYLDVFTAHPEFYKFLREFDAFLISEKEKGAADYEDGLDLFKEEFLNAYNEGLKDGSVKGVKDVTAFYYATTHALLGLCAKLSKGFDIVKQDELIKNDEEINTLIDIILFKLKSRD